MLKMKSKLVSIMMEVLTVIGILAAAVLVTIMSFRSLAGAHVTAAMVGYHRQSVRS